MAYIRLESDRDLRRVGIWIHPSLQAEEQYIWLDIDTDFRLQPRAGDQLKRQAQSPETRKIRAMEF